MTSDMKPQAPSQPRLTRPKRSHLAGVAEGLARHFDLSPALVRLGFVVLAFMGGFGVLLYILCWLLIPEEDQTRSMAERAFGDDDETNAPLTYVLIGVAAIVVFGSFNIFDGGMIIAAGLFAAGLLLWRNGSREPASDAEVPLSPSTGESPVAQTYLDAAHAEIAEEIGGPPLVDYEPLSTFDDGEPQPRTSIAAARRSYLGRLTLAFSLVAIGVIALLDNIGLFDAAISDYLAAVLGVIGLGLIAGAFVGRARWLILPGLVVMPMLLAASLITVPLSASFGQFDIRPTSSELLESSYDFGGADVVLDLTQLPALDADRTVSVDMGAGQLQILVPTDINFVMDADVGAGEIVVFDVISSDRASASTFGVDDPGDTAIDIGQRAGVFVEQRVERIADDGPVLEVVVDVAFGSVELTVVVP